MAVKPQIVDGDLLDQPVEAIVNSWNRNLIPWWLLLPHGGAVLTGAGRLPHKAIIHVAGIGLLWISSEKSVRASVRNALALARQHGLRSIAFPLIGAGVGGGAEARVMTWMQDEMARCEFAGEVRIVRFRS